MSTAASRRRPHVRRLAAVLAAVVGVWAALAALQIHVGHTLVIDGHGMSPTLRHGEVVFVLRGDGPGRGAVVAHRSREAQAEQNPVPPLRALGEALWMLPRSRPPAVVGRVVGVPGDRVDCCDDAGRISINGVAVNEPHTVGSASDAVASFSVVIPLDRFFVLGDDRSRARDSRCLLRTGDGRSGLVERRDLLGTVAWGAGSGSLQVPSAAYTGIPDGNTPMPVGEVLASEERHC